jgi:hypothetical protein
MGETQFPSDQFNRIQAGAATRKIVCPPACCVGGFAPNFRRYAARRNEPVCRDRQPGGWGRSAAQPGQAGVTSGDPPPHEPNSIWMEYDTDRPQTYIKRNFWGSAILSGRFISKSRTVGDIE